MNARNPSSSYYNAEFYLELCGILILMGITAIFTRISTRTFYGNIDKNLLWEWLELFMGIAKTIYGNSKNFLWE